MPQLFATVHRPLSYQGSRMQSFPIQAEPNELVSSFKMRMQPLLQVAPECMTVIYNFSIRKNEESLAGGDDAFKPSTDDNCFIHIRVEDPEMEMQVQQLIAKGFDSICIPLDQVIVEESKTI